MHQTRNRATAKHYNQTPAQTAPVLGPLAHQACTRLPAII